jgi:hypothetical protein
MTKIDTKKVIGSLKSKDRQYNENSDYPYGMFSSLEYFGLPLWYFSTEVINYYKADYITRKVNVNDHTREKHIAIEKRQQILFSIVIVKQSERVQLFFDFVNY